MGVFSLSQQIIAADIMSRGNSSNVPDFILLVLVDSAETQLVLFLLIYLVTLLGNAGMTLIICLDPQLDTPMYFLLTHLSFLDLNYSSVITPKILKNLLTSKPRISQIYAVSPRSTSLSSWMSLNAFFSLSWLMIAL